MGDDRIHIGYVARAKGLRGTVAIKLFRADGAGLTASQEVWLGEVLRKVARARQQGALVEVDFVGVTSRTAADELVSQGVYINRADIAIDDDEVLLSDLVGYDVFEGENLVGRVVGVHCYPAADVLRVMPTGDHTKERSVEFELPYVHPYVLHADTRLRRIAAAFVADVASAVQAPDDGAGEATQAQDTHEEGN